MKLRVGFLGVFFAFFLPFAALAADALPATQDEFTVFLNQVLLAIRQMGGLGWMARVSLACTIIVGSMKVPGIKQAVWDKLEIKGFKLQAFVAPVVGLVGGILSLKLEGGTINLRNVLAFLGAGAGGIILYELLDAVKLTGVTNKIVLTGIDALQSVVKKKS